MSHLGPLTIEDIEEWKQDKATAFIATSAVLLFLSNGGAILRALGQWRISRRFFYDDGLLLFALLCSDALSIQFLLALDCDWAIPYPGEPEDTQADQLRRYTVMLLKILFTTNILNGPILLAIRLSLLLMYRRLLVLNGKWIRRFWWANVAYTSAWAIAALIYVIFHCRPPRDAWNVGHGSVRPNSGHCDSHRMLLVPWMVGIPSDICVLLIPVIVVFQLRMTRAKKIGLAILFSLGGLACVCEVARIIIDFDSNPSQNTLTTLTAFASLTMAEFHVAIFCACLPPIAPMYHLVNKYVRQHIRPLPRIVLRKAGLEKIGSYSCDSPPFPTLGDFSDLNPSGAYASKVESSVDPNHLPLPRATHRVQNEILVTTDIECEEVDRFETPFDENQKDGYV